MRAILDAAAARGVQACRVGWSNDGDDSRRSNLDAKHDGALREAEERDTERRGEAPDAG